jgi:hypothetical protein
MSIFPRMGQRTKIILPIRSNLATYNEIPEHTEITATTTIPSVQDGPTVVARYRNLTISNGATLTTSHRCCGLVVVVNGDLTIGVGSSLSMTARGASFAPAQNHKIKNDLFPVKDVVYEINIPATADEIAAFLQAEKRRYSHVDELPAIYRPSIYALAPTGVYVPDVLGEVPIVGGAGAAAQTTDGAGNTGAAGTDRKCGGGGSGAASGGRSGGGRDGTCYSGGSGGGAARSSTAQSGFAYGGAGGWASSSVTTANTVGGGAGNPGGSGATYPTTSNGQNGTGGLLIVICTGKITNNGAISSVGSRGGDASACGGGGSGGGSVNIFYGTLENSGTISATGGAGGSSTKPGGAGGNGCVTLDQCNF